jgi:hypothetical protein
VQTKDTAQSVAGKFVFSAFILNRQHSQV